MKELHERTCHYEKAIGSDSIYCDNGILKWRGNDKLAYPHIVDSKHIQCLGTGKLQYVGNEAVITKIHCPKCLGTGRYKRFWNCNTCEREEIKGSRKIFLKPTFKELVMFYGDSWSNLSKEIREKYSQKLK